MSAPDSDPSPGSDSDPSPGSDSGSSPGSDSGSAPRPWTGDGTRAVHAGLPEPVPGLPAMPGPVFAAHYHLPGDPAAQRYDYGRTANPTWTALEEALAGLESPGAPAAAAVFASGMGAIAAVLLGHLRSGDTVVLPSDGYHGVRGLAERLTAFGIGVTTAPTGGPEQLAAIAGARLVLLETPANPRLDVCDIRALAAAAHAEGALLVVDNTLPTPLGQRPLELGADISVASGTKGLSGHGDVLLGYAVARDPRLLEPVIGWRTLVGAIPGPMESWLAHRGLATLQLRLDRQSANALAIAEWLGTRPGVSGVRHPGLPGDPSHAVAARQMHAFGCLVSFALEDRTAAEGFLGRLRLIEEATSFGGVRSTAERRGRWGEEVPDGFIRLSAGVEDLADLLADLGQALDGGAG